MLDHAVCKGDFSAEAREVSGFLETIVVAERKAR